MKIFGKWIDASTFEHESSVGDGATKAFAITYTPIDVNALKVFLNGLLQRPTTDYSLSGTTVTFVSAPADDQDIDFFYMRK